MQRPLLCVVRDAKKSAHSLCDIVEVLLLLSSPSRNCSDICEVRCTGHLMLTPPVVTGQLPPKWSEGNEENKAGSRGIHIHTAREKRANRMKIVTRMNGGVVALTLLLLTQN